MPDNPGFGYTGAGNQSFCGDRHLSWVTAGSYKKTGWRSQVLKLKLVIQKVKANGHVIAVDGDFIGVIGVADGVKADRRVLSKP